MSDVKIRKRGVDPIPPHDFPMAGFMSMSRTPIAPTTFDPNSWYQVKEFCSTRGARGYLRLSRTAFLEGVKAGEYPPGRKIGHQRFWWGRQLEAIKQRRDWREVAEPDEVLL